MNVQFQAFPQVSIKNSARFPYGSVEVPKQSSNITLHILLLEKDIISAKLYLHPQFWIYTPPFKLEIRLHHVQTK